MAMGPMGGRGMRPAEKSKRGLRGVQRELFSYSERIRLPMLIALVLAAAGAVLTILGPNQLSKITNLISDSLMGEIDLAAIGRVAGVLLGAVGVYEPFARWAGAGASVPLTGFGNLLAGGVRKAVAERGVLGAFTGGFTAGAAGICAAIFSRA